MKRSTKQPNSSREDVSTCLAMAQQKPHSMTASTPEDVVSFAKNRTSMSYNPYGSTEKVIGDNFSRLGGPSHTEPEVSVAVDPYTEYKNQLLGGGCSCDFHFIQTSPSNLFGPTFDPRLPLGSVPRQLRFDPSEERDRGLVRGHVAASLVATATERPGVLWQLRPRMRETTGSKTCRVCVGGGVCGRLKEDHVVSVCSGRSPGWVD